MPKKAVRYAAGLFGAVPAVALIVPAATAAPVTTHTGKSVRVHTGRGIRPRVDVSCAANQGNHHTHDSVTIRFYSKVLSPTLDCIGTIQVSTNRQADFLRASVINSFGHFCVHSATNVTRITYPCKHPFRTSGLTLSGFASHEIRSSSVHSSYSFRHNGFTG